jgi:DNA polymerase-3 subunit beta
MIEGTITAKPQVFAAAVKWAAKFIATKPVVPMQGGLLLDIEDEGLYITAYNEVVTARAIVPVAGRASGSAVVSGRLLAELVATFPNKEVEISGGTDDVLIAAGRWHGSLPTMNADDFPEVPTEPNTIGVLHGGDALHDAVAKAAAATQADAAVVQSRCVHLTFEEERVTVMASDSYRAARARAPFAMTEEAAAGDATMDIALTSPTALLLGQVAVDVTAAFMGPDDIEVGLDGGSLSLTSATRSIVMRQISEPYDERIGKLFGVDQPEHVRVKVADLTVPLKRAGIMQGKGAPVVLHFGPDLITINVPADDKQKGADEEVDAEYSGPEHTLKFNPDKLGDALGSAPGGEVDIAMRTGVVAGVVITVPGNDDWRHLLQPLKGK